MHTRENTSTRKRRRTKRIEFKHEQVRFYATYQCDEHSYSVVAIEICQRWRHCRRVILRSKLTMRSFGDRWFELGRIFAEFLRIFSNLLFPIDRVIGLKEMLGIWLIFFGFALESKTMNWIKIALILIHKVWLQKWIEWIVMPCFSVLFCMFNLWNLWHHWNCCMYWFFAG